MQNLSSSESMDFRALLLNETRKTTGNDAVNRAGIPNRNESDAESGFEDGGSSLTLKSMNDGAVEPVDMDSLQIYNLLTELQSVAVEWKSLRKVHSCSCAMPFEHFTKKVGVCLCVIIGFLVKAKLWAISSDAHQSYAPLYNIMMSLPWRTANQVRPGGSPGSEIFVVLRESKNCMCGAATCDLNHIMMSCGEKPSKLDIAKMKD